MRFSLIILLILLFASCGFKERKAYLERMHNFSDGKDYSNMHKFDEYVSDLHTKLSVKYDIKEFWFDTEYIYEKEDLTELVDSMLRLGGYDYEVSIQGLDSVEKEFYSIFNVQGKQYEFRTTALSDWVEMEQIIPALDSITKNNKPSYEYNFSNIDGGQAACMIFGKTENILKAVDEGFPCNVESGRWNKEFEWNWGVYSDVRVDTIPNMKELKIKYHVTLADLYSRGYDVPNLTLERIYIDKILNEETIDIVIDGGPMTTSFNDIVGSEIRCFWEGWGVALAYTLIKHYDGEPSLYDKKEKKRVLLKKHEYIVLAETAFGKR